MYHIISQPHQNTGIPVLSSISHTIDIRFIIILLLLDTMEYNESGSESNVMNKNTREMSVNHIELSIVT